MSINIDIHKIMKQSGLSEVGTLFEVLPAFNKQDMHISVS